MSDDAVGRLRRICVALPEAVEKEAWGDPTFRVREKIFAMVKVGDGRVSVWCKAPPGSQEVLIGADPERFFRPPYVGSKGWVGMRLDDTPDGPPDWDEVRAIVVRSYGLIAPRRLARRLEPRERPPARPGEGGS
ncbi:MAG: MmcQ/YjbR family DNA-binding protein [Geminicoccaceae bacterium]|nr:MmcQ/YjbR family DNA-binding protein [Geminicoccaceae bacterium]